MHIGLSCLGGIYTVLFHDMLVHVVSCHVMPDYLDPIAGGVANISLVIHLVVVVSAGH